MGLYVRVKLCRDLGKARAHVNYIAFRSREMPEEERGAFDRRSDHADVRRFNERIEDHMTRHPMANKAYKMHISLSEREFRELGLTSWKPVLREAMANLEQKWGRQLSWIASEHMAKGHPHVHLLVKAAGMDDLGRFRQLRLGKEHLQDINKEVGRVIDRNRTRVMDRGLGRDPGDLLVRSFDRFLSAIVKQDREESRETERAHQRWLRKSDRREQRERER